MERTSESGFPIDPVYDASKLTDFRPEAKPGRPGEYPFTRGVYPRMDVDRLWTMRQHAGFAPFAGPCAIERGFQKAGIESSAYQVAREIDECDRIVVGVNKFAADGAEPYQPLRVDPAIEAAPAERLHPLRGALRTDATLGEVGDALRDAWGAYHPSEM